MVAFELRSPALLESPGARLTRGSSLAILDAAYRLDEDEATWLGRVAEAAKPVLGSTHGIAAYCYRWREEPPELSVWSALFSDCPPEFPDALADAARSASPEFVAVLYSGKPVFSLEAAARRVAKRLGSEAAFEVQRTLHERAKVRDVRFLMAQEPDGSGCALAVPSDSVQNISPRTAGLLALVARHLAAARRLRAALRTTATGHSALEVEAVVDQGGHVVHAEGVAQETSRRATLSAAARALSENRARFASDDPDRTVMLWNALVEGRWSLVATEDADGKRYWLARRNTVDLPHPAELSPEERHLAALMALGQPSKLIAYELGLSAATISELSSRVLRKLRLRSRAELVALFSRINARRRG
ncbi:MAG TPA: helix-turn-helix transcriptional regulator [Polyangiaceae bacterium]